MKWLISLLISLLIVAIAVAMATEWEPDVRLTDTVVSDVVTLNQKSVVTDQTGRVHVVWYSDRTDTGSLSPQIWYKRYNPGSGWTEDTCISGDVSLTRVNELPSIACDSNGNIHVVWYSTFATPRQIRVKTCRPTGNGNGGWDENSVVVLNLPANASGFPDIACTPDNHLHLAFTQNPILGDTFYRLFYIEKVGSTWGSPLLIDSGGDRSLLSQPRIAGSRNNNVHITWDEIQPDGYREILYRARRGGVWDSVERVTDAPYTQVWPSLACHPITNNPHIVWTGADGTGSYARIIHRERTVSGWQPPDTVSESGSIYHQFYPKMTVTSDGKGHCVWTGYTQNSPSVFQIRYNQRSPDGAWGTPQTLTNSDSSRYYPSIATSNSRLHLVWYDRRDGNSEIYYKNGGPGADVGPSKILSPVTPPPLPVGQRVWPCAIVKNYGLRSQTFPVEFTIGTVYRDTQTVNLAPGESTVVWFDQWTPGQKGSFPTCCVTLLSGDEFPGNDTVEGSVDVYLIDVQPTVILQPVGNLDSGAVISPQVRVRNNGSYPASFSVRVQIGSTYNERQQVLGLAPDEERIVVFPDWQAVVPGAFSVRCTTELSGDMIPANDLLMATVRVLGSGGQVSGIWQEKHSLPFAPSGKAVNDGGWLAFDPSSGLIYAVKGNNTPDFYCYYPVGDSWRILTSIPAGNENKLPKKGCVGVADGHHIYMTKGNNTQGFWQYHIDGDSWTQLEDVPLGASGKKVKGGTDMVYVFLNDTGYVYLLKGYKTEFYRYNTVTKQWETLPDAPAGTKPKWDKGSWLVYDGDHYLYAHKAKYHELWRYDLSTGAWDSTQLKGMPFYSPTMNRNKKSKDGGCATYYDGAIYALKGNNTCEFWCYFVNGDDSWKELDTIPSYGSTGKKKRVKAGGDIVATGASKFFAFKGNKTLEFWQYDAAMLATLPPVRQGVMAENVLVSKLGITVTPNPLTSGLATTLRYCLPQAGLVRLVIYDVTGRGVVHRTFVAGRSGAATLDLRQLASGVYLIKFENSGYTTSQKLILR